MFPSVTGKMFPKSICDTDTSAPYNIPCGIKNIFAIECSNPMVTNAVIGQKMAKIFPATLVEAIVPHTAKHTNQLHSTPLTNATVTGNVVAFIVAIAIAGAGFAAEVIATYAMYAKNTDPAKLPAYDTAQFFITCARVTFFDNKPLNITNTFPVNNSAPVNITMVNPNGKPNRPFTRFESPGFAAANAGELFGLSKAEVAMLNEVPMRGTGTPMPPTDPLIYRFYEMVMVNGPAWKALIEEEFGDGIMSAIDFDMGIERVANPKGDRVKITMSGKFLPYKYYGASGNVPEYGFKEE